MTQSGLSLAFTPLGFSQAEGQSSPKIVDGIIGETVAQSEGKKILQEGGNVVDAIITAAATSAITSPQMCGFGGYGGHLILALENGKKITCFDFNTQAPKASKPDMFLASGKPNLESHSFGWLSFGVPGILAGLFQALKKYGTISWRRALSPAIHYCENGFMPSLALTTALRNATRLFKDPTSKKLYFPQGKQSADSPSLIKNPALAKLLNALAEDNSVAPFYQGEFAKKFANFVQANQGILSYEDLASYKAIESEPLRFAWNDFEVCTAPLTSGGFTILETLGILKQLDLKSLAPQDQLFARIESLRLAWRDRLKFLGDPLVSKIPQDKFLSISYHKEAAEKISAAVKSGKCLPPDKPTMTQNGTINLSAFDRPGNMAALTLTHGGYFGSQVSIEPLGLTLGHGMSRFNIQPDHPNSVAPNKRPLNNMCPTVLLQNSKTVAALGGRGGRKIPNAVFEVVFQMINNAKELPEAINSPRIHTEGNLEVELEKEWPKEYLQALNNHGLKTLTSSSANVSAVGKSTSKGTFQVLQR